jgi:hypothetical protein
MQLIKDLEGLALWGFKTSIGGMTIEAGSELPETRGFKTGALTLWIQTRMRLYQRSNLVLETPYPSEGESIDWTSRLAGQTVVNSNFDDRNHTLKLLLTSELLLTIVPGTREAGDCWMMFDNRRKTDRAVLVVYKDIIEVNE